MSSIFGLIALFAVLRWNKNAFDHIVEMLTRANREPVMVNHGYDHEMEGADSESGPEIFF